MGSDPQSYLEATHRSILEQQILARRKEEDDWISKGLGLLCINQYRLLYSDTLIFCGHRAHPGGKCGTSFDSRLGSSPDCNCQHSQQVSQRQEDEFIIGRHLPSWEQGRLTRLIQNDYK